MISVIMGTYNGRSRIDKAISSIKKQTYTDWELIICDDCSSDGTYEYLINKYKDEPKIIITQLQKNSGLSSALNRCIELSHGEYLARMDDDDYSQVYEDVSVTSTTLTWTDPYGDREMMKRQSRIRN